MMSENSAVLANEISPSDLLSRTAIIVPTYNASRHWVELEQALLQQGVMRDQILIVDSSSSDDTCKLAQRSGFSLKSIQKESFRHGATRQMAADALPWAEHLVYLTQDAIPRTANAIANLVSCLADSSVGAAYGRQLPRNGADPIEAHARTFNYSDSSEVRVLSDRKRLGIKAAFFSNSFAAYRRTALEEVHGFPLRTIVSEDVTVAARMLLAGWKIAYNADAEVLHSHALSLREEASRYFDIGVHHAREKWLLREFGSAGGEGATFVASELRYLLNTKKSLIPLATIRNMNKWLSYQLGLREKNLPIKIKEFLSAQPNFWSDERTGKNR